jgi:hypothetical protein
VKRKIVKRVEVKGWKSDRDNGVMPPILQKERRIGKDKQGRKEIRYPAYTINCGLEALECRIYMYSLLFCRPTERSAASSLRPSQSDPLCTKWQFLQTVIFLGWIYKSLFIVAPSVRHVRIHIPYTDTTLSTSALY